MESIVCHSCGNEIEYLLKTMPDALPTVRELFSHEKVLLTINSVLRICLLGVGLIMFAEHSGPAFRLESSPLLNDAEVTRVHVPRFTHSCLFTTSNSHDPHLGSDP